MCACQSDTSDIRNLATRASLCLPARLTGSVGQPVTRPAGDASGACERDDCVDEHRACACVPASLTPQTHATLPLSISLSAADAATQHRDYKERLR
jgi:hypothetical protein